MPIRLTKPYNGQAAGTLYWGTGPEVVNLRAVGIGDDNFEQATDYQPLERDVTTASVNVVAPAIVYIMNSASAQTVNLIQTGWLPKGSVLTFVQVGAGAFTIAPGTGVTVNTAATSLISKGQWNVVQLIKRGPDQWVAAGGLGG